jgi:hypothetical protein
MRMADVLHWLWQSAVLTCAEVNRPKDTYKPSLKVLAAHILVQPLHTTESLDPDLETCWLQMWSQHNGMELMAPALMISITTMVQATAAACTMHHTQVQHVF